MYCFDIIAVEIHGNLVQAVEYSGFVSTINAYISAQKPRWEKFRSILHLLSGEMRCTGIAGLPFQAARVMQDQNPESGNRVMPEFPLISVYPNPFENEIFIKVESLQASQPCVEVWDLTGKQQSSCVLHFEANQTRSLSMEGLSNGIYFIKIKFPEQMHVFRVSKLSVH